MIKNLRESFVRRLQRKTGWGRNEVVAEFDQAVTETGRNYEHDTAVREGCLAASLDAYFSARPHIKRTAEAERIYEAGHTKGWNDHANN